MTCSDNLFQLFERILEKSDLNEQGASKLIEPIVYAVRYCSRDVRAAL